MNPVIIKRRQEHEARQAVADLEKRGFVVTFGPKEFSSDGKVFSRDSYNRRIFQENVQHSVWIAKLEKVAQ